MTPEPPCLPPNHILGVPEYAKMFETGSRGFHDGRWIDQKVSKQYQTVTRNPLWNNFDYHRKSFKPPRRPSTITNKCRKYFDPRPQHVQRMSNKCLDDHQEMGCFEKQMSITCWIIVGKSVNYSWITHRHHGFFMNHSWLSVHYSWIIHRSLWIFTNDP